MKNKTDKRVIILLLAGMVYFFLYAPFMVIVRNPRFEWIESISHNLGWHLIIMPPEAPSEKEIAIIHGDMMSPRFYRNMEIGSVRINLVFVLFEILLYSIFVHVLFFKVKLQ